MKEPGFVQAAFGVCENWINKGLRLYLAKYIDKTYRRGINVLEHLGKEFADQIEWSAPRLLCIAGDFTKYDKHAVKQINRNIELIRYKKYEDEFLLFELVNATTATTVIHSSDSIAKTNTSKTVSDYLEQADQFLKDRYFALRDFIINLGDDVQEKVLKFYVAFKRIQNFACIEVHPQTKTILLFLKVDPDEVELQLGFTRDMRNIGHYGTGDLEVRITSEADIEMAKGLIVKSYEVS